MFFNLNILPDISIWTVWDESKDYFGGLAIRFSVKQKEEKCKICKYLQVL